MTIIPKGETVLKNVMFYILSLIGLTVSVNCFAAIYENIYLLIPALIVFPAVNALAGMFTVKTDSVRLRVCHHGGIILTLFAASAVISTAFHIYLGFVVIPDNAFVFVMSLLYFITLEAILFWNGIISTYLTSVQLGIRQRVVGVICGFLPIANVIALYFIIKTVLEEVRFETEKEALDKSRKEQRLCETKYPLLLVHGVFFRDRKYFNYWGRIPRELEINGAKIFYGNHQSASSVQYSGQEIAERIKTLVKETGCEKLNIIAHSKGGLDCRWGLEQLDAAPYVASLTTVSSPHRGSNFADYLLTKSSAEVQNKAADMYNAALHKFGDSNPDFLSAVNGLTSEACEKMNEISKPIEGVFCQSVGSVMPRASGGRFPLNFSYMISNSFPGENDGLVNEGSFQWGEKYTLLRPACGRGISHGDMIDLNRENIKGFDVREFYVQLVNGLKERGL